MALEKWLDEALCFSEMTQAELARRLTESGHRTHKTAVGLMLKGVRKIQGAELLAIAEITGYPIPLVNSSDEIPPEELREWHHALAARPREARVALLTLITGSPFPKDPSPQK
jgi:hypothetical protein